MRDLVSYLIKLSIFKRNLNYYVFDCNYTKRNIHVDKYWKIKNKISYLIEWWYYRLVLSKIRHCYGYITLSIF